MFNRGYGSEHMHGHIPVPAEITPIYNDQKAICTIISDDGYYESGKQLDKLCSRHGLEATIAGAVKIVDQHLIGWKQIISHGNLEIVNHSYSHQRFDSFSGKDDEEELLRHELLDSRDYLKQHFDSPGFCFVPPENNMTIAADRMLLPNGIHAVRQGFNSDNPLSPAEGGNLLQWRNLGKHDIGGATSAEDRNHWVDEALANGRWLIEMWHDVCQSEMTGFHPISVDDADAHMRYLVSKKNDGLWVAKFSHAAAYLKERQHCSVQAEYIDKTTIEVSVDFTDDVLPRQEFTFPLTVKLPISKAKQMKTKKYSSLLDRILGRKTHADNQASGCILVNVKPGSKAIVYLEP